MADIPNINISSPSLSGDAAIQVEPSKTFNQNSTENRRFATVFSLKLSNDYYWNEGYYRESVSIPSGGKNFYLAAEGEYGAWKLTVTKGRGGNDRSAGSGTVYGSTYVENDNEFGSGLRPGTAETLYGPVTFGGVTRRTSPFLGFDPASQWWTYEINLDANQSATYDVTFHLHTMMLGSSLDNFYILH